MNWKKILLIVADIIIGVYLVMAVTSFNKPEDTSTVCNEVVVAIESEGVQGFLTTADVRKMLQTDRIDPRGMLLSQINTRQMEELLQDKDLVEEAQVYTTVNGNVHINIRQRVPVVRVMAMNGDNYFVDNHGKPFAHTDYSCDLMVATGHISKAYAEKKLVPLANVILADPFWRSQVEQLNVLADGSVELVPRVGDHIAYLGQPVGVTRKLERLRKFYLYGLSQAGWNKYKHISVEFDNQIICKRK